MGDHHHQPTSQDLHSFLGVVAKGTTIRDVCKAYKNLVMRWNPDKTNKSDGQPKFKSMDEAYDALGDKKQEDRNVYGAHDSSDEGSYRNPNNQFSSLPSSLPKSLSRRSHTPTPVPTTLPKSRSQKSTTPIMFSYSTVRRKPPPIEKKLECTLEELCHGCVKKIKITRDVITDTGIIVQEEELLRIKVKPGWKKGTKITFEGMGDEKPGMLPADITFSIDEKEHPLFKREEEDLVYAVEIPLVKALTGSILSIPLLGGEKMSLSFSDVIFPGYEKIIMGQGMPNSKEQGTRGNLRIKFQIIFPNKLSDEQRSDVLSLLKDSS